MPDKFDPVITPFSVEKKKYMPRYYYKYFNGLWRNGKKQSSYELTIFVRRALTNNTSSQTSDEDYQWVQYIYNIIRSQSVKYGKLALNDDWCHYFTDEQLKNFQELVENTD